MEESTRCRISSLTHPLTPQSRMDSNGPPGPPQSSVALFTGTESIALSDMQTLLSAPVGNDNTITYIFNANPNATEDGNGAPTNSRDEQIVNLETSRADHEIYSSLLLTKKRGFPLWVPGPNRRLPIEYRQQGISLGDVGIINSLGVFCFLFNVFQPPDHPINRGIVPRGFSTLSLDELEPDIQEDEVYGPETYLASSSVKRVSMDRISETFINQKFESTAKEAAILIMPDGAISEDLQNTESICDLIANNAAEWYKYATVTRGRKVKNGDIRVVVGVDKASSWGIATSACNTAQTASYEFKHDPIHAYRWNCTAGSGRVGPRKSEIRDLMQDNPVPKNQCVFVRTMNFTLSGEMWRNFPSDAVEEADPGLGNFSTGGFDSTKERRSGGGRGDGTGSTSSGHRPSSTPGGFNCAQSVNFDPVELGVKHPSGMLHQVLHEKFPDANVIITDDVNWIRVLSDDDGALPEPIELCDRMLKTQKVQYESGVVRVLRKDDTTSRPKSPGLGTDEMSWEILHSICYNLDDSQDRENQAKDSADQAEGRACKSLQALMKEPQRPQLRVQNMDMSAQEQLETLSEINETSVPPELTAGSYSAVLPTLNASHRREPMSSSLPNDGFYSLPSSHQPFLESFFLELDGHSTCSHPNSSLISQPFVHSVPLPSPSSDTYSVAFSDFDFNMEEASLFHGDGMPVMDVDNTTADHDFLFPTNGTDLNHRFLSDSWGPSDLPSLRDSTKYENSILSKFASSAFSGSSSGTPHLPAPHTHPEPQQDTSAHYPSSMAHPSPVGVPGLSPSCLENQDISSPSTSRQTTSREAALNNLDSHAAKERVFKILSESTSKDKALAKIIELANQPKFNLIQSVFDDAAQRKIRRSETIPAAQLRRLFATFFCILCHAELTTNSNLQDHYRRHLQMDQYRCRRCGEYFRTEGIRKRHTEDAQKCRRFYTP